MSHKSRTCIFDRLIRAAVVRYNTLTASSCPDTAAKLASSTKDRDAGLEIIVGNVTKTAKIIL